METKKQGDNEITILQSSDITQEQEKAQIDIQIATAKKYPRNMKDAVENALTTVTMSVEVAESCYYSLNFRKSKDNKKSEPIEGPSINLAKILAQCWGNLRFSKEVIGASATHVTSQAMVHDLETNIAAAIKVQRPILYKDGGRYNNDLIILHGSVGASIALREAIFSVIPKAYIEKLFHAAKAKVTNELDDATILVTRRNKLLKYFKENHGVDDKMIAKHFDVSNVNMLNKDQVLELSGLMTAIQQEGIKPENIFEFPDNTDEIKNNEFNNEFGDAKDNFDKKENQQKTSDEATKDGLKMESPK